MNDDAPAHVRAFSFSLYPLTAFMAGADTRVTEKYIFMRTRLTRVYILFVRRRRHRGIIVNAGVTMLPAVMRATINRLSMVVAHHQVYMRKCLLTFSIWYISPSGIIFALVNSGGIFQLCSELILREW